MLKIAKPVTSAIGNVHTNYGWADELMGNT